ncbi:hypothetical protein Dimus_014318 [Dionaea muscipula]
MANRSTALILTEGVIDEYVQLLSMLRRYNCAVTITSYYEEALSEFQEGKQYYDIVVSDIENGLRVYERNGIESTIIGFAPNHDDLLARRVMNRTRQLQGISSPPFNFE